MAVTAMMVVVTGACGTGESDPEVPETDVDTTGGGSDRGAADESPQRFPDVIEVEVTPLADRRYEVAATLSSPYDSPERYADAWRVLDEHGNELGRRELLHDHAAEQPFTRSTTVEIPDGVEEITVEGRDQLSGYGGGTVTVAVPRDG
ncbi:MAG: hypothetical protein U5K29_09845 [Acidimicrobiales bacterium]|nr:hypothetical protein [Acidimicrobiales bacterium]